MINNLCLSTNKETVKNESRSHRSVKWREDRRCGKNFFLKDGTTQAECNPSLPIGPTYLSNGPCCSESGRCGGTIWHCQNDPHTQLNIFKFN